MGRLLGIFKCNRKHGKEEGAICSTGNSQIGGRNEK